MTKIEKLSRNVTLYIAVAFIVWYFLDTNVVPIKLNDYILVHIFIVIGQLFSTFIKEKMNQQTLKNKEINDR